MSIFLKVREIKTSKYKSAQFTEVSFFLLGESNKRQKVYAFIRCELHLVKRLRANILINNDILALENFVLNIALSHALIKSCKVKITIRARQRGQFLKKRLFAKKDRVISPRSKTMVLLLLVSLLDNKDFLFHSIAQPNLIIFAYIMHHDTKKILIRNTSNHPLRISHCQKLGYIVDI